MSGGVAYVLDEDNDLYTRTNKEMVFTESLTNKYDVLELKNLISEHVNLTNSAKGKEILDHFGEYLPKFKKIIRMIIIICRPPLCRWRKRDTTWNRRRSRHSIQNLHRWQEDQMGKPTGFLEYEREVSRDISPKERIQDFHEFHVYLSKEKQQIQGARCMECGVPFCQSGMTLMGMASGCPLHNLVPEWNDLVYRGNWKQAYERLARTNNFPEFTSRVCPALCEKACTCGLYDQPVSVRENEHGIIENAYAEGYAKADPPQVRTGKRVAVVGSGPAGLAAADQLNQRGHLVTVYERDDRVGGLLMYGIPNMKLEKQVIDRKIRIMEEEGITFLTGVNVGKEKKAAELLKEYDAVVLACGAKNPRDINAPGRDAKGIYFAVDYLARNTKSLLDSGLKDKKFISAKGKHVVIIGGGDTGNDCVGTAIRQGAKSVTQLEMMPKAPDTRAENNPWPEWPKVCKTDYGQEEPLRCSAMIPGSILQRSGSS